MIIIHANISVDYQGRGDTFLDPFDRIVMIKKDGSVSIHSDLGYKPLNYMSGPVKLEKVEEDEKNYWIFSNKKEKLIIHFHKIYSEKEYVIEGYDMGLQRAGTEDELQEWLSKNIHYLDTHLYFIKREYETGDGPVDILAGSLIQDNILYAVEIKRSAALGVVGQTLRYVEALKEKHPEKEICGIVAAVDFTSKTLELAQKRGIRIVPLPKKWNELDKAEEENIFEGTLFDNL